MENENSNIRIKTCPQCQVKFSCCIEKCWCSEMPMIMPLTDKAECYCPNCLEKIIVDKIESPDKNNNVQPKNNGSKVIEDMDYYYNEEGYFVFTSHYHLKRGYCCKNGCKHCPYGFSKEK